LTSVSNPLLRISSHNFLTGFFWLAAAASSAWYCRRDIRHVASTFTAHCLRGSASIFPPRPRAARGDEEGKCARGWGHRGLCGAAMEWRVGLGGRRALLSPKRKGEESEIYKTGAPPRPL